MESLQAPSSVTFSATNTHYSADILVIQSTLAPKQVDDAAQVNINHLPGQLAGTARQILEKLNELLKGSLPGGVQSLKPEDHTPEKTADNIIKGIANLFHAYSKQHPELEGEELLTSFMEKARAGVSAGYDDAYSTLSEIGAFDIEGVQHGIEQTKVLLEEKLSALEDDLRKKLGLETDVTEAAKTQSYNELLQYGRSEAGLSVVA